MVRKGFIVGLARVLAAGAVTLLVGGCLFVAFPFLIHMPVICASPCPISLSRSPSGAPNCEPASLKLELFKPEAKVGVRYPLWYRGTLRNDTCFTLGGISAERLLEDLEFRVRNAEGAEIGVSTRTAWNEIIPYQFSQNAYENLRNRAELKPRVFEDMDGDSFFIDLPPGTSVQTLPVVLSPQLNWLQPHAAPKIDTSLNNPAMKPVVEAHIRGRKFIEPPDGFAPVDGFIFREPGKYRIEAKFPLRFSQELLYPRLEWYLTRVPAAIRRVIGWPYAKLMNEHFERPGRYSGLYVERFDLDVRSNSIEFEVVP